MSERPIELKGLKGGKKQLWINQNRQLIIDYWRQFGDADTRAKFTLEKSTLQSIIARDTWEHQSLEQVERAIMRADINDAGIKELRHEIRTIKEDYGKFTQVVSRDIADNLFKPLLSLIIQLPEDMEPPADPLSLRDFSPPVKRIEAKKDG